MLAAAYEKYGSPDIVRVVELPEPECGDDEVLVRVHYAGINPVDWKIGEGRFGEQLKVEFPLVVGREIAGHVVASGRYVSEFEIGDRVAACLNGPGGGLAEVVAVPTKLAASVPDNVSTRVAASVPLAALTSWQALVERGQLASGQTAFVLSGAGGTGSFALQIAASIGATVLTTCSDKNVPYVKSRGASIALDYAREDVAAAIRRMHPAGLDFVFSNALGGLHEQCYGVLKEGGKLVTIGEPPSPELASRHGIVEIDHVVWPDGKQLAELLRQMALGDLTSPEITEAPLDACAEALNNSRTGHTRGKIVVRLAGEV